VSTNDIAPETVDPETCHWIRDRMECVTFRRTTSGRWVADVVYAIEVRLPDGRVVRFEGDAILAGKQVGRKPRKAETRPRRHVGTKAKEV
jgi:hypothetical protein